MKLPIIGFKGRETNHRFWTFATVSIANGILISTLVMLLSLGLGVDIPTMIGDNWIVWILYYLATATMLTLLYETFRSKHKLVIPTPRHVVSIILAIMVATAAVIPMAILAIIVAAVVVVILYWVFSISLNSIIFISAGLVWPILFVLIVSLVFYGWYVKWVVYEEFRKRRILF